MSVRNPPWPETFSDSLMNIICNTTTNSSKYNYIGSWTPQMVVGCKQWLFMLPAIHQRRSVEPAPLKMAAMTLKLAPILSIRTWQTYRFPQATCSPTSHNYQLCLDHKRVICVLLPHSECITPTQPIDPFPHLKASSSCFISGEMPHQNSLINLCLL